MSTETGLNDREVTNGLKWGNYLGLVFILYKPKISCLLLSFSSFVRNSKNSQVDVNLHNLRIGGLPRSVFLIMHSEVHWH